MDALAAARRPRAGQNANALIGNDAETVAARIGELRLIVAEAAKGRRAGRPAKVPFAQARHHRGAGRVAAAARDARRDPDAARGPAVGVYAICLDTEDRLLPAECQAVAVAEPGGLRVAAGRRAGDPRRRARTRCAGWCARLARAMAPVRDVSGTTTAWACRTPAGCWTCCARPAGTRRHWWPAGRRAGRHERHRAVSP